MSGRIREVPITNRSGNNKNIKALYDRAFPENERFPYRILRWMTVRNGIEFTAYYDGDLLCGISYVVSNQTDAFLWYLAVDEDIRSKGYGTRILKRIKEKYRGKQICLNVEPPEENADNAEQRKKRIRFYEKNGFSLTGCGMKSGGEMYRILSDRRDFNKDGFRRVIGKLWFGLFRPKVFSL